MAPQRTRRHLIVGAAIACAILLLRCGSLSKIRWVYSSSTSYFSASHPRRIAFVHIGPHKTASSYIQTRMCGDLERLGRMDVVVPIPKTCPRCYPKYFCGAVRDLLGDPRQSTAAEVGECSAEHPWEALKETLQDIAETQPSSSVFFSAEALDRMNSTQIGTLAQVLHDHFDDVQIIAFYRPKLEHILSVYTQRNKEKGKAKPKIASTLSQFIFRLSNVNTIDSKPHYFLQVLIANYGASFGVENVHIVSYSGIRAAGRDPWDVVVEDVMGLPPMGEEDSPAIEQREKKGLNETSKQERVNVSPDYLELTAFAHLQQLALVWMAAGVLPIVVAAPGEQHEEELAKAAACAARVLQEAWGPFLPIVCSSMQGIVLRWEQQELDFLASLRGRARLWYFEEDMKGKLVWTNVTATHEACDVDMNALLTTQAAAVASGRTGVQDRIDEIKRRCLTVNSSSNSKDN